MLASVIMGLDRIPLLDPFAVLSRFPMLQLTLQILQIRRNTTIAFAHPIPGHSAWLGVALADILSAVGERIEEWIGEGLFFDIGIVRGCLFNWSFHIAE